MGAFERKNESENEGAHAINRHGWLAAGLTLLLGCTEHTQPDPADSSSSINQSIVPTDEAGAIKVAKQYLEDRFGPGHYVEFRALFDEVSVQWCVVATVPVEKRGFSPHTLVIIDRNGNPSVSPGR